MDRSSIKSPSLPSTPFRIINACVRWVGPVVIVTKMSTNALSLLPILVRTAPSVSTPKAITLANVRAVSPDANASTTSTIAHRSVLVSMEAPASMDWTSSAASALTGKS